MTNWQTDVSAVETEEATAEWLEDKLSITKTTELLRDNLSFL